MNLLKEYKRLKIFDKLSPFDFMALILYACFCGTLLFVFPYTFPRLWECIKDFGIEIYNFGVDFINHTFKTTIELKESSLMTYSIWIKDLSVSTINLDKFKQFWIYFIDRDVFLSFVNSLIPKIKNVSYMLILIIPLIGVVVYLFNRSLSTYNGDVCKKGKSLIAIDYIYNCCVLPFIDTTKSFVYLLKNENVYKFGLLIIASFFFNAFAVIFEAFALYFHFLVYFDFLGILKVLVKIIIDVLPGLLFIPLIFYVVLFIALFDKKRKDHGYKVLDHHEAMNRGFIASLPLINFIWGTMGSKKTTLLTDMALSYSSYFRFKAYQLLLDCDLLFPDFPWLKFEKDIKYGMSLEKGDEMRIYNLRTCELFVKALRQAYIEGEFDLYGYDLKTESPDGLVINDLFDVLSDYAKLYLIYVVSSSLIVSNYSIREDSVLSDLGNFPIWNFDFFRKDPKYSQVLSKHSHILDFDMLRLGIKMIQGNRDSDGFEFGIVCITEIAKDRGNKFDLQRIDKSDVFHANQITDRFNDMLKLVRHFGTVRNFPFVVFLVDDQRPSSLSADVTDLTQLIHVADCSDKKCTMNLRFLDDYLHDISFSRFTALYQRYRYYRADYGTLITLYKRIIAFIHKRYTVSHNTFDYFIANLEIEKGTRDSEVSTHPYFVSTKKIYSDRFATDCFSGFVDSRVSRSDTGIMDVTTFASTHATIDEMKSTNSYLIRDLTKILLHEKVKK